MDINLHHLKFSFYGFGISIQCQDQETLQNIRRDYSYFVDNDATTTIFFEISNEAPDYNNLPLLEAKLYSPRNICYTQGPMTYFDYFGKGLSIIDHQTNLYKVFCAEPHLRHEIVFLSIISLVGQNLDSRNMHRVHSLGLEINHKALLLLMPSGGGKTTFLLELMKNSPFKFISEDSPLIDASGNALPFPIRIGMTMAGKPVDIPDEKLHLARRMEFGPKYLLDVEFFKDKISTSPLKVQYILCGTRCLGMDSSIRPRSKWVTLKDLITNCVVGVKLYQGIEFLLQHGVWELLKKSGVLFSRFRNSLVVLMQAKTYTFVLGYDRAKNMKTFLDFCQADI